MISFGGGLESLFHPFPQMGPATSALVGASSREGAEAMSELTPSSRDGRDVTATHVVLSRLATAFAQRSAFQGQIALHPKVSTPADAFDSGEVANNVLDFVANAINGAKARGEDSGRLETMLAQAREGIEQGFGEAKEALRAIDFLSGNLEQRIDDSYGMIGQGLNGFGEQLGRGEKLSFDRFRELQPDRVGAASQSSVATFAQTERSSEMRASMEFRTQEGDVVRVHFSDSRFDRQALGQRVASDSNGAAALAFSLSSTGVSREFGIEIEGELSQAETDALGKVFEEVASMSTQFFEGDPQRAFEMAKNLGYDDEQIAGFTIGLSKTETQAVSQATAAYSEVQHNGGGRPQLGEMLTGMSDYARHLFGALDSAQVFPDPRELISSAARMMNDLQIQLFNPPGEQRDTLNSKMQGLNDYLINAFNAV